jgi:hypothetical protein
MNMMVLKYYLLQHFFLNVFTLSIDMLNIIVDSYVLLSFFHHFAPVAVKIQYAHAFENRHRG